MRALYTTRYGGPEVLQVKDIETPKPARGEILIAVNRAGLNFAEIAARMGMYPDAPKAPMVVGYEVSGTIEALGEGVNGPPIGTRVLALTRFGGHASHVCVPEEFVMMMPAKMTFDEAAALPVNYLTAFHMLFVVGHLRPYDRVLVHQAAGGVGIAAVQLANIGEGVVIFGTASAKKHALLKENGCTHPIDYRSQDYVKVVRELTGGRGVNIVLDALGGPDWTKGYELLIPTGQLICFGWTNMVTGEKRNLLTMAKQFAQMKWFSPMKLITDNKSVTGVNMGHLWGEKELMRRSLSQLIKLYQDGKIRPHVDKVFPMSAAADAHRYVQQGKNVGKVLFDPAA
ncbi:MAG: medium chain dehydrogenase/reductase family protein [Myxococcaceae bacterium]